jgi:hypothetical protein
MSDTVKLIIEIPKDYYEIIKHEVEHHLTDYRPLEIIGNGIPLDTVKAEIVDKAIKDANGEGFIFLGRLLRIFDNIGKAESEVKPNEQ